MIRRPRTGVYNFLDFLELVHEDQKADLLDGVIYMASPESIDNNKLVGWLYRLIAEYAESKHLGEVTVNRVAFRLTPSTAPEPDIALVASSRIGSVKSGYVDGPPDLAVEIVSPESVERDYDQKRHAYQEAGVKEYWIIDPDEKSATFLSLEGDRFIEMKLDGSIFHSAVLPGFYLDTQWLWQRPLPEALPTILAILGRR